MNLMRLVFPHFYPDTNLIISDIIRIRADRARLLRYITPIELGTLLVLLPLLRCAFIALLRPLLVLRTEDRYTSSRPCADSSNVVHMKRAERKVAQKAEDINLFSPQSFSLPDLLGNPKNREEVKMANLHQCTRWLGPYIFGAISRPFFRWVAGTVR